MATSLGGLGIASRTAIQRRDVLRGRDQARTRRTSTGPRLTRKAPAALEPLLRVCPLVLYSPECVEGKLCELRHNGVLRRSALPLCSRAHTFSSARSMVSSLRGLLMLREGAGRLPVLLLDLG